MSIPNSRWNSSTEPLEALDGVEVDPDAALPQQQPALLGHHGADPVARRERSAQPVGVVDGDEPVVRDALGGRVRALVGDQRRPAGLLLAQLQPAVPDREVGVALAQRHLLADMARTVDHVAGGRPSSASARAGSVATTRRTATSSGPPAGGSGTGEALPRIEARLARLNPPPVRRLPCSSPAGRPAHDAARRAACGCVARGVPGPPRGAGAGGRGAPRLVRRDRARTRRRSSGAWGSSPMTSTGSWPATPPRTSRWGSPSSRSGSTGRRWDVDGGAGVPRLARRAERSDVRPAASAGAAAT